MKALDNLKYNIEKFYMCFLMDFGADVYGGLHLRRLHIIPQKEIKSEYLLMQRLKTDTCSCIFGFYLIRDRRTQHERVADELEDKPRP